MRRAPLARARVQACLALALASCTPGLLDIETSSRGVRPDEPGFPSGEPRFDAADTVETFTSPGGRVKIHFARTGRNAALAGDTDVSGVPDYVELAAATYDEVRALYHGPLGLREPAGDALVGGGAEADAFDVYLVDFAGRGDGAYRRESCLPDDPSVCSGFMLQENDFARYGYPSIRVAARILASHEYFHAVQAAYDADQDTIFNESTAVWATERFDPTLDDFEGFVDAYLSRPDRPLNVVTGGVTDAKSYGTAIFFQFLSESFGERVVPDLLAEVVDGANGVADPEWFSRLDPYLARVHGSSFDAAFRRFATWNLYTGDRADPTHGYARSAAYPRVAIEAVALPYELAAPRLFPASTKYLSAPPDGRAEVTAALVVADDHASELDHLSLYLSAVRGTEVADPVAIADPRAGVETIDVSGADEVIAFVVDTELEGASRRPNVCLGSPGEVSACRDRFLAADPPDAGSDADAGSGGPDGGADAGVAAPRGDDGGCSTTGASGGASLAPLALVLVLAARRRR